MDSSRRALPPVPFVNKMASFGWYTPTKSLFVLRLMSVFRWSRHLSLFTVIKYLDPPLDFYILVIPRTMLTWV